MSEEESCPYLDDLVYQVHKDYEDFIQEVAESKLPNYDEDWLNNRHRKLTPKRKPNGWCQRCCVEQKICSRCKDSQYKRSKRNKKD